MQPTPLAELMRTAVVRRSMSIGLPAQAAGADRCFALTPEGAAILTERGFTVRIEDGASSIIHYPNSAWAKAGAEIVDRRSAFACDIVIHPAALQPSEAAMLRRGALLFTFLDPKRQTAEALEILIRQHVTAIAMDEIAYENGRRPFADMIRRVSGRAAMAVGAALLADSIHGKGILLGGIPGVVPCEVMIIGSDTAAEAAARSALGQGAIVRMFDNDFYRLANVTERIGGSVIGSAIHPKVYASALHSADIIIVTDSPTSDAVVTPDRAEELKRGVVIFDISSEPGRVFPWLKPIDLDMAVATDCDTTCTARVCFVNAASSVPRTLAMGLTNIIVDMFERITVADGLTNALRLNPGLCAAAYTFMGKPVGAITATRLGVRQVDINMFLQFM